METLFRWIHLSDIHMGHGDKAYAWDQRLVTAELSRDIAAMVKAQPDPPIDAIFVTGDIANTGAGRAPGEYEEALKWLEGVGKAARVPRERIFVVPGNHDVDRGEDARDADTAALIKALREGSKALDDALANPLERARLASRQQKYAAFARLFAPVRDDLFWTHHLVAPSGLAVRIVGLNTAILAAADDDQGKLRVGMTQIGEAFADVKEGELVLVLGHHPLRDGWLADQAQIEPWVKRHAHALLTGHVHEADAELSRSGASGSFVRIVAGSVHGDKLPPGVPAGHGYSFGAVVREGVRASLHVIPRKWSAKNASFRADIDNIPGDGQVYSAHELPPSITLPSSGGATTVTKVEPTKVEPTRAAPVKPALEGPVPVFVSGSPEPRDIELRDKLLKHLKPLSRSKKAAFVSSEDSPAGEDEAEWIAAQIAAARVILLLISPDYMGDDNCYEGQLQPAIERHKRDEARVIPIMLRRYDVGEDDLFAGMQRLPRNGKPVDQDPAGMDDILARIAKEMKVVIAEERGEPTKSSD